MFILLSVSPTKAVFVCVYQQARKPLNCWLLVNANDLVNASENRLIEVVLILVPGRFGSGLLQHYHSVEQSVVLLVPVHD